MLLARLQRGMRHAFPIAIFATFVASSTPDAQTPVADFATVCRMLGGFPVTFVGRTEPPVTYHVSGETEIEKARQNLLRVEKDVARLRSSLDPLTRLEREREFAIRIVEAQADFETRRAM